MLRARGWFCVLPVLACASLTGCGGGGGSAPSQRPVALTARNKLVDATRVCRHIFAVAGLARYITKAPRYGMGDRAGRMSMALKHRRDVQSGTDPGSGLNYVDAVYVDGSGREDLYVGATNTASAGAFLWGAPAWSGSSFTYPATINATFQITGSFLAGDHGTVQNVWNDSSGQNGTIRISLTDAFGEHSSATYQVVNGTITGQDHVTLPGGVSYVESDVFTAAGACTSTIDWPSGDGSVVIDTTPDGSQTEADQNGAGVTDATGDVSADGTDVITYDDGSSETVDVDTGDDTSDSSGDSSGAGSDGGDGGGS